MSNENLRLARQVKNDEFYTRYEDIEKELVKYKDQFKGKIVYCNCDAPESNFIKFFNDVQTEWQIKEVLHTSLKEGISYDSPKALELLDKCDIVVTNPPFSKVRNEFLPLIERSGKQFLFIGNLNMATFKEVFPLIRDGKLWTGYTHPKEFLQPDGTYKKFGNTLWWTNMFVDKPFTLNPDKKYYGNEDKYPRYDNYDAINVDKLADIPSDYSGIMGVPVTFIEHYVPPLADRGGIGSEYTDSEKEQMIKTSEPTDDTTICDTLSPSSQFEIKGQAENLDLYGLKTRVYTGEECRQRYEELFGKKGTYDLNAAGVVDGKKKFGRIFVKNLQIDLIDCQSPKRGADNL